MEAPRRQPDQRPVAGRIGDPRKFKKFHRLEWWDALIDSGRLATLSTPALTTLCVLFRRVNGRGHAWPARKAVAAATGRSERTVRRGYAELVDAALIELDPTDDKPGRVRFLPVDPHLFADADRIDRADRSDRAPGQNWPRPRTELAAPYKEEPHNEPHNEPHKAGVSRPSPESRPDDGLHIKKADDLRDVETLRVLTRKCVDAGYLQPAENNLLTVAAAAQRALRVGRRPAAVFVQIARTGRWDTIANEDEQRAERLIKGPLRARETGRTAEHDIQDIWRK